MKLFTILYLSILLCSNAWAGPGAHGPNGEHLDGPPTAQTAHPASPRMEAFSETFELVGQLQQTELSILIDRYETNEPVLNGKLELEVNGIKANATFHADRGDYTVADPKILQVLAKPGKHALLLTISAGDDHDLLEAQLTVAGAPTPPPPAPLFSAQNIGIACLVLAAVVLGLFTTLRRRQAKGKMS